MQIEAALSQLPRGGGKGSLQARLDEVRCFFSVGSVNHTRCSRTAVHLGSSAPPQAALEKCLERVNRELGSIRMTLKRFHVLRSSANI